MDEATKKVIKDLGIDPATVPPNQVRLLNAKEISSLGKEAEEWAKDTRNIPALAYSIDDEFKAPVGLVLRNLQKGADKRHLTVSKGEGPFWHNLHCSLPAFYESGIAVLVEGPKDARVLWSNGIPAAAYLGPAPGSEYLRVIKRYADVVLWIPDVDPETRILRNRKQQVHDQAKQLGLLLVEYKIEAKDPAELVDHPEGFTRILERVSELAGLI